MTNTYAAAGKPKSLAPHVHFRDLGHKRINGNRSKAGSWMIVCTMPGRRIPVVPEVHRGAVQVRQSQCDRIKLTPNLTTPLTNR